jgi:hypothetical protein
MCADVGRGRQVDRYWHTLLVGAHGFDHVLATRLHHDDDVAAVLEQANAPSSSWEAVPEARSFCAEVTHDSRRFVVVFSPVRYFRDKYRHLTLCAHIEDGLIAIEERVRAGRLVDPAKIGAAADRVLRSSPVGRCFVVTIRKGFFSWDFDEKARSVNTGPIQQRAPVENGGAVVRKKLLADGSLVHSPGWRVVRAGSSSRADGVPLGLSGPGLGVLEPVALALGLTIVNRHVIP